ncbi:MAG: GNAT family N-acetyltransferase, partial [Actinomycetota bacterium]|nr:GNAT family N-acetyltransferase [Actinomycetota bacterium]
RRPTGPGHAIRRATPWTSSAPLATPRREAARIPRMGFPETLCTPRLTLRRWREEHVEAMAAVWGDPDVWRALRPGEQFDPEFAAGRAELHVRHWHEHGFGLWVVEERASGELAGWVGPWHPTFVPELADRIEIGWTLRRPFWGRGLAVEGAEAAVAAAFSHLGVDEVISLIYPGNRRSIAVARRLGMGPGRVVRHPGIGQDLRIYALTGAAWSARRRQ